MEVLKEQGSKIIVYFEKAQEVLTIDLKDIRIFCTEKAIKFNNTQVDYEISRERDIDFTKLMKYLKEYFKKDQVDKLVPDKRKEI
jgi:hypothetical protein